MAEGIRDTTDTGVSGQLTDGSGIGTFDALKLAKDLIADALLGAAAGLAASGVTALPQDQATTIIAGWAIANAIAHSLFRVVLKWAQS